MRSRLWSVTCVIALLLILGARKTLSAEGEKKKQPSSGQNAGAAEVRGENKNPFNSFDVGNEDSPFSRPTKTDTLKRLDQMAAMNLIDKGSIQQVSPAEVGLDRKSPWGELPKNAIAFTLNGDQYVYFPKIAGPGPGGAGSFEQKEALFRLSKENDSGQRSITDKLSFENKPDGSAQLVKQAYERGVGASLKKEIVPLGRDGLVLLPKLNLKPPASLSSLGAPNFDGRVGDAAPSSITPKAPATISIQGSSYKLERRNSLAYYMDDKGREAGWKTRVGKEDLFYSKKDGKLYTFSGAEVGKAKSVTIQGGFPKQSVVVVRGQVYGNDGKNLYLLGPESRLKLDSVYQHPVSDGRSKPLIQIEMGDGRRYVDFAGKSYVLRPNGSFAPASLPATRIGQKLLDSGQNVPLPMRPPVSEQADKKKAETEAEWEAIRRPAGLNQYSSAKDYYRLDAEGKPLQWNSESKTWEQIKNKQVYYLAGGKLYSENGGELGNFGVNGNEVDKGRNFLQTYGTLQLKNGGFANFDGMGTLGRQQALIVKGSPPGFELGFSRPGAREAFRPTLISNKEAAAKSAQTYVLDGDKVLGGDKPAEENFVKRTGKDGKDYYVSQDGLTRIRQAEDGGMIVERASVVSTNYMDRGKLVTKTQWLPDTSARAQTREQSDKRATVAAPKEEEAKEKENLDRPEDTTKITLGDGRPPLEFKIDSVPKGEKPEGKKRETRFSDWYLRDIENGGLKPEERLRAMYELANHPRDISSGDYARIAGRFLDQQEDKQVRLGAATTIMNFRYNISMRDSAKETLQKFVQDPDPTVRAAALQALGQPIFQIQIP